MDRLEVGPVRLQTDRLTAPYRVHVGGQVTETELRYRWEHDVFDPERESDQQLAAVIGSQVALNYGLFCKELVLHGRFDSADRTFLARMAENTAREIYVKKFLEPNPFIRGDAASLPVVQLESYMQARLGFPDATPSREGREAKGSSALSWEADPSRIAVLSSGGKDSLLSYGLLSEMGFETHSVFVNESGRHWFTARNAYRHLQQVAPTTTTRVWTSADRVFSWMLQHLPFVRPDHARVRADDYPIRLWTVAVFLFGALPVLQARGIGRIVIGDEYDTTRRVRFQGITHYDGLYDQSRFFDEALTRYYRRKGWPLVQFSLLRQMSELLIQKTLAERYPALLRQQVSCHAAHIEDERAFPCGRCEKCRRIVGMLLAVDEDPRLCGYTDEQITQCIEGLAEKGVKQDSAESQQLAWMLAQRDVLPEGTPGLKRGRERKEVLSLRFDRNASPLETVPADVHDPLYEILLEHTAGAIEKMGWIWNPYQLRSKAARPAQARAGELSESASTEKPSAIGARPHVLGEMTWPQAKSRFSETDIVLLPAGAFEQHGPHLPLDIDGWDADHLCREVAERCSDPKPLVLPLIPYGVSYHHDDFPGTLSVGPDTLAQFVYEVGMAAARHGATKLVIVNGHGGNAPALQLAAQKVNRDARIFTCVDTGETSDVDINAIAETRNDVHAGEIETSTALATRPHLVDKSRLEPSVPEFSSRYLEFSSRSSVEWYEHTARISDSGVLGDPTVASREKGERMWALMIDHLVRFVEMLKELSLDEIVEQRH
jgi:creatinine amidohydrolase/Fe(II)-dependent formamide hydrolase-like protein/7-cyano-7-deazaguanine synthase in queuosine biosynthesis